MQDATRYADRVLARWPLLPRLSARLLLAGVCLLTWRPGRG